MLNVTHGGQQGIHINVELMATTAVEILLLEVQRSLITVANQPLRIHIPGKWVDRKPGV